MRSSDVFSSLLFGTAPDGFKATQLDVHLLAQNLETDALAELRSTLGMIFAPNEADGYEVLESIWQNTQKAVSWAYQTLKRDGTLSGHARELPRITAKPCFNESILELHLEQQDNAMKSLFGAVIEAALGVRPRYMKAEGNTHHPLREGIQQIDRKVDEATAWRLHFHADYRLHYWLLPNGDMELSLVVVHENAKIV